MKNKKMEIAKFYKQIFSDIKLKEKLEEKARAIANTEDFKKLIQQEIVPIMKKYNVNFSEKELLEYEEESLKKLSEEDLFNVSGGVSIKSALLTGGILSMALLGGIGLNASAMDDKDPPPPPGEERRVLSSNNASNNDSAKDEVELDEPWQSVRSKFNKKTGTLTIYGEGKMLSYDNATPWSKVSDSIKNIVIEDGVTLIREEVFFELNKVTKITIAGTVTEIGQGTFSMSPKLKEVIYLGINDPEHSEDSIFPDQGVNFIVPLNYNGDTFCNEKVNKEDLTDNPYMQQSVRKRAVNLQLENSEGQNLISRSDMNVYMQAKAEGKIALANDGNIFGCTLDPSGQGIILTDIYTLVDGVLKIPSQGTIQDGRILNVTAVTPNLKLKELETRNLINESRENDYEQAKNENRIAIGGGHIFSYMLASSGNGVILTDIYTEVVDGILVIPPEVTTQDGQILPVVGIGGDGFRTATFETVEINPLTKSFRFGDASFYTNKNIKRVDCSKAKSLEFLEIGDSAFEDSSLKSIVAPPQEVKIVTGKDAYGTSEIYEDGKLTKKDTLAPIAFYETYEIYFVKSKPRFSLGGLFKTASMPKTIDRAKYTLKKLKSIINLSCLVKMCREDGMKDDLEEVVSAIENNELNSLEQSDRELLLNAYRLLENEDYDSQINVKPSKIGNNNNDSNNHGNDNDDNNGGFGGHDNDNNNNNDNDDGGFNDHGGNNNDNDHNNNQGPKKFVDTNENNEVSEQQSDNESQEIQAEARMEVNYNNEAANSESEDNNKVVAKTNVKEIKSKAQTEVTDDSDSQKISVGEFLAHGSLSSDKGDDVAFVKRFITQNPVEDLENKINRETAQKIVKILDNFFGENFAGQGYNPDKSMINNYMMALGFIFDNESESDEKNDNFSGSDDNRNDKDNSSDSSKHDGNDNDDDNDDDDTPKKLKTKKIKINSNKKRISSKTKSKTSAKTGKKKINAKNSDIDLKNADNDNSKEPEVAAMPEESNNNALKQEVAATKEESNNNKQKPETAVATEANSNANDSQESKAEVATDKGSNDNDNANSIDHGKIVQQGDCGDNGGNVKFFKYEDNHLDILGQGAMKNYGYKYVKDIAFTLAPWGTDIKSVTIGPSVTSIGGGALCGCSNLTEVHVSDTVKFIGELAFSDTGLTSFDIPRSVTSIGSFAFSSSQLKSIFIPNNVKKLGTYVFSYCNKLETVTVEEGIDGFSYADEMFRGCASLKTVNLPSSFIGLSDGMFAKCTSLEEITLTTGHIPERTFSGCTALKKVNASQLRTVKKDAFSGCKNLTNIGFADTLENSEINIEAFINCEKLTNIYLGKVKKIKDSAFKNCTSLEKIIIPSCLEEIGNYVFDGCENLTDVTYEGNRDLGSGKFGVFRNCEKLKRIKLTSNWGGGKTFCGYPVVGNEVIVNDNDESLNKSKPNKKVKIRRGKKKAKRKPVNKNIETSTDDDYDDE